MTIPVFKDLIYPRPMPQFNFEGTYDLKIGKRLTLFKIHKTLNVEKCYILSSLKERELPRGICRRMSYRECINGIKIERSGKT